MKSEYSVKTYICIYFCHSFTLYTFFILFVTWYICDILFAAIARTTSLNLVDTEGIVVRLPGKSNYPYTHPNYTYFKVLFEDKNTTSFH